MDKLTMYGDLAEWWPLLSPPEEYAEEAAIYQRSLLRHAKRPLRTLLELGRGGWNKPSYLKARVTMTLVDAFHPNELQRKRAIEIQQKPPVKLKE